MSVNNRYDKLLLPGLQELKTPASGAVFKLSTVPTLAPKEVALVVARVFGLGGNQGRPYAGFVKHGPPGSVPQRVRFSDG